MNRNLFLPSDDCSAIVPSSRTEAINSKTETQKTRKDGEAVDSGITNIVGAAPDLSRYREHIAHLGLSAEGEAELLTTVWRIMGNFVDRAFGDDPVQHVNEMHGRREKRRVIVVGSGNDQATKETDLSSAFASPAAGRGRKDRS